jgi:hypothetical protein
MEEAALALILDRWLEAIERGGDPEAIAGGYPELSSQLLPILKAAAALRDAPVVAPVDPEFFARLGERLRQAPGSGIPPSA